MTGSIDEFILSLLIIPMCNAQSWMLINTLSIEKIFLFHINLLNCIHILPKFPRNTLDADIFYIGFTLLLSSTETSIKCFFLHIWTVHVKKLFLTTFCL